MEKNVVKVLGFSAREKQFAVKTENFSFTVKDGKELLADNTVSSNELLLAKLAGSIHSIGNLIGNTLNLNLKSIQIEVKGIVDCDQNEIVSVANFKKIDVTVKPSSEASIILLKEWIDAIKLACPVFTSFRSKTTTIITLVKEYDQINVA